MKANKSIEILHLATGKPVVKKVETFTDPDTVEIIDSLDKLENNYGIIVRNINFTPDNRIDNFIIDNIDPDIIDDNLEEIIINSKNFAFHDERETAIDVDWLVESRDSFIEEVKSLIHTIDNQYKKLYENFLNSDSSNVIIGKHDDGKMLLYKAFKIAPNNKTEELLRLLYSIYNKENVIYNIDILGIYNNMVSYIDKFSITIFKANITKEEIMPICDTTGFTIKKNSITFDRTSNGGGVFYYDTFISNAIKAIKYLINKYQLNETE